MVDLDACLRGDKAAWDAFVDRFARVIYSAVRRTFRLRAGPVESAEVQDVAQNVFLRLVRDDYRLLKTYDPGKAALATWLTIVARSVALDHLRRRRVHTVPLEQAASQLAEPAEPTGREAPLDLPAGLLSARQQLVLRLLFDEGATVAEAADLLGVDAQTIRSTKHKAIRKLRDLFGVP
jgi:RNA polymerase sigma-70 factor (ECF subfamily)